MEYQRCILMGGVAGGIPDMHLGGWSCRWNTRDALEGGGVGGILEMHLLEGEGVGGLQEMHWRVEV